MRKVILTGGAGFLGSHLTEHFLTLYPKADFVIIDAMTYAARREYLRPALQQSNVTFVQASICNRREMLRQLRGADLVLHAAAESHVDNSYADSRPFLRSNIEGTVTLLQAAVENGVSHFVHVSTDEVYGDCRGFDATERSLLNPTNPYSASKAAAEMFVKCFAQSFGLATRVVRANNIYGTRQYPEKLIPKLIVDALAGRRFRVHGSGMARRPFLHVRDLCRAIETVVTHGDDGAIYNVPAARDYSVNEVVNLVCAAMHIPRESFVEHGTDRPHNDSRYGMTGEAIHSLGWEAERELSEDLPAIVQWYRENLALYLREPAQVMRMPARLGYRFVPARRGEGGTYVGSGG